MKPKSRFTAQLVLGLIIIFVGVVFTLDNLGYLESNEILRYWPALVIIYGVTRLVQSCSPGDRLWGAIVTFVGAALLVDRLHIWSINLWDFWPLLLVLLGGSMIWRSALRKESPVPADPTRPMDPDSFLAITGIMSGQERVSNSPDFRGGDITVIMGGVEIDLRKAVIKEQEAVIDLFAFWGGISLKVPENWIVINEAMPIMGGIDDKSYRPASEHPKRLVLRGNVIMGGIEVQN